MSDIAVLGFLCGSIPTAVLLHWMYWRASARWEKKYLAEIARLRQWGRLTDAEREAVRFCVTASLPETEKLGGVAGGLCRTHAATLRGLLERTAL